MIETWSILLFAAAPVATIVQDETYEELEGRVTAADAREATIDRGTADGVRAGDRVTFFPREGGSFEGTVRTLDERSARVELADPNYVPSPGTKVKVRVHGAAPAPAQPVDAVPNDGAPRVAPAHPAWPEQDEAWKPGDPLLARVRALRPEERLPRTHGRFYLSSESIRSTEDDRTDQFQRLGGSFEYENPWGRGDALHVDAELNYRDTSVPDFDDDHGTKLRVDRLSYHWGGTRFAADRFEVGRFWQSGVPQLGLLDGFEWTTRAASGNRGGVSIGFMPELDEQQDTGDDLQIAAFYRWVNDASERVAWSAAYQKTFHQLAADRDLVVLDFRYLPIDAWTFVSTAWVDVYGSTDGAKGSGVELTQMLSTASRRWSDGSSLALVYSHYAFPELARNEFPGLLDAQIADAHSDRLSLRGRKAIGRRASFHTALGAWVDQDENGGDAELGFELDDLLGDSSFVDLVGFETRGRFSNAIGGRASFGLRGEHGSWRADYEFAQNHLDGFSDDNDDLPQHRVRLSGDHHTASGWSVSGHVDVNVWDSENSVAAGFYVQRSF